MKKVLVIMALIMLVLINKNNKDELIIPDASIRFRVIANSNTYEDIFEKNKISKYLDKKVFEFIKDSNSADEAKKELLNNKSNISSIIDKYLLENKINMNYELNIGKNYFPTKYYKGIKYDAGYYDSVVLKLGESSGMNWWCVIYPPLCLIDDTDKDEVEYTTLVKEVMNKYQKSL